MEIRVVGNTEKLSAEKAQVRKVQNGDRTDSVISFWLAEEKKKADGSKKTIWHKVTAWRGFAETIARQLGADNSRKCQVVGTAEPKFYTTKKDGRVIPYFDIQAKTIDWMDNKWPANETPAETAEADDFESVEEEPETPWN